MKALERMIYAFADAMGKPLSFVFLTLASVISSSVGFFFKVSDGYTTFVANTITLVTLIIGQAVLVSARRSSLANDLKQDRIIEALPGDNDAIGIEEAHAAEIEREKRAVEARAKQ